MVEMLQQIAVLMEHIKTGESDKMLEMQLSAYTVCLYSSHVILYVARVYAEIYILYVCIYVHTAAAPWP